MKRCLLIAVAVLLLSCFLISCKEDVKSNDSEIVGTWTCTEVKSPVATYTWNLTLKNDGTYTMEELYNGDFSQKHEGEYSADGAKWVGTVTNISDFFTFYTSDKPCYVFEDTVDETHRKLGFSEKCEDPLDYENTYDWDAEKKIYSKEQSVVSGRHEYWSHKFGATSYEYNSTGITKDGSGNEMYNMAIVLVAKAQAVEKTQSAQKVFAKYYDYDISKCSWKMTSSYKKTGDTLSLYWLGSEHTFTKK